MEENENIFCIPDFVVRNMHRLWIMMGGNSLLLAGIAFLDLYTLPAGIPVNFFCFSS